MLPFTYICQSPRTVTNPSLFPASIAGRGPPLRPIQKPYSRLLGAINEARGQTQLLGRTFAHLLGHLLGLSSHALVGNHPQQRVPAGEAYLTPDPYPGAGSIVLSGENGALLYSITENGDHLRYTPFVATSSAPEDTVYDNPIDDESTSTATATASSRAMTTAAASTTPRKTSTATARATSATVTDRLAAASTPEYTGLSSSCTDSVDNDDDDGDRDSADAGCVDGDGVPTTQTAARASPTPASTTPTATASATAATPTATATRSTTTTSGCSARTRSRPTARPRTARSLRAAPNDVDDDHDGLIDDDDPRCRLEVKLGPTALHPGFAATDRPASDDDSTGPLAIGFDVAFGERTFSTLFGRRGRVPRSLP